MAINGTNGDDDFRGTSFAEEINGLGGNDYIGGSRGADTLDGGGGENDTVDYKHFFYIVAPGHFVTDWGEAVDVDLQRAVQSGGFAEGDVLRNIENVSGSIEDDTIRGNSQANLLFGEGGNDLIEGRDGDDIVFGDGAARFIEGPPGNDHIDGGAGNDQIHGDEGDDILIGGIGVNSLDGGTGVDTAFYAASTAGMIVTISSAGVGNGVAISLDGSISDALVGIENVTGSEFADNIVGSSAANELEGRNGNDTLGGLAGADALNGGIGTDTATYVASASGVVIDLAAGTGSGGDAGGDTLSSIEHLIGSNSPDALYGSVSANTFDGGGGADVLVGRGGNDVYIVDNSGDLVVEAASQGTDEVRANTNYTLAANQEIETLRTIDEASTVGFNLSGNNLANLIVGNAGNNALFGDAGADTLIGARGVDIMRGGSGADTFVWRVENESGTVVAAMDLIVDFDPLAGDRIDLSGIDANALAAGNQAFTFIGAAAFSGAPGEINFVQVNGETIIQIQTGVVTDIEMGIRISGLVTPARAGSCCERAEPA